MIDVGGPAMLRAAAKNYEHVTPVCRPDQYDGVLAELRANGELSLETRRQLAAAAFATTAAYESAIAAWFSDGEPTPRTLTTTFDKVADLPYGENPHQRAALYAEAGARRHVLSRIEQLQGDPLSFNNLVDLSAARALTEEFTVPACVIVKHSNPCGVALGTTIEEAYANAQAADPVSAYGGVVVCNRPVEGDAWSPDRRAVRERAVRARLRRRRPRRVERQARNARAARLRAASPLTGRAGLQAGARRPADPGP